MLNLAKAISAVTPDSANGTLQVSTVSDLTVVAFIGVPDPGETPSVWLVVLLEGKGMSTIRCTGKRQYDAAMKLLTECDIGNEDEYLEAEYAQPHEKEFRWIP